MIKRFAENQNWAKAAPWMGIISAILLFVFFNPSQAQFWAFVNIPLYLLHQTEEHYKPGGFKRYMNQVINNLPEGEEKLDDILIFWINIGFVWIAFTFFGILSFYNIGFGLLIIIFSIINCMTHISQGIKRREWNPGLVMASIQFIISLYGAYFITVNALTNQWIWWSCSVIFSVIVHVLLFKKLLKD